jgi:hypothetical protein
MEKIKLFGNSGKANSDKTYNGQNLRKLILFIAALFFGVFLMAQQRTSSGEWTQFRGPNRSVVKETGGLPAEFGPSPFNNDYGMGASPILVDNKLILVLI